MGKGFIYLHRQIQECWIWFNDERFSQGQAWVDLLLSANHKDVKLPFNGEFVTVERGQLLTSIRKLADRWKWHRNTVKRFLNLLEKDNMIELNVCFYEKSSPGPEKIPVPPHFLFVKFFPDYRKKRD